MADEKIYGPDGHTGGPYGTMEGRENGGGWIDQPLAHGADNGLGIWAQPPAPITGANHGPPPTGPGNPNFLELVDGWHKSFLLPRQR